MRTMYDDIRAANIPADAPMVAGYIDTIVIPQWSDAEWARFPNVPHVEIVKKPTTIAGHVADCEKGDFGIADCAPWIEAMRAKYGFNPTIYCSLNIWSAVQNAIQAYSTQHPNYWVAHYDNVLELPTLNGITAVAKQHTSTKLYDLSCVADYWEGVDYVSPSTTTATGENTMLLVPAGNDDHVDVIVRGYSKLYIGCSYGRTVNVTAIDFWGDTGNDPNGNGVGGAVRNQTFVSNRPGPVNIPAGASTASIRYTADHSFGVGVA
jgi:hypothetical protein